MISESEYLAPAILFEKGKVAARIIYSNVKELVEEHEYMFDTLWSKAISAQQRIREIEEAIETTQTKVLDNKAEIFDYLKSISENTYEQSTCCSIGGMKLVYNDFFDDYKKIVRRSREGEKKRSKGVRWITSIVDRDSIDLVKTFLNAGMQVRHIKNLTHMDFAVDSKNFNATIDKMEGGSNRLNSIQALATNVHGGIVPFSGHWIPEEQPDFVVDQLFKFFGSSNK
jgi:hypothetical protein